MRARFLLFSAKEKVIAYLSKVLRHFKVSEYDEIVPEYFETSVSSLEKTSNEMKVRLNAKNLAQILLLKVINGKWDVMDILTAAFNLELEHVIRHSSHFIWTANSFVGTSTQGEIADLGSLIQSTVRHEGKDAFVLVKKAHDLFWISVVMKNLKTIGIYEKPRYLVLSSDGRYFFTKDVRSVSAVEYMMMALGYDGCKKIKLTGKSLPSLMKLLIRRETISQAERPFYSKGEAIVNEEGIDFTQKQSYYDYYDQCVDTDIDLQRYAITSVKCPWLGDDNPVLSELEFKTMVTLSGDVGRIIKNLPVASIVKPPIPNYLRNYSIKGRNTVSLKANLNASLSIG